MNTVILVVAGGGGVGMIKAFVYSSCTSCRKTEEALMESGVDHEVREFFRDRFSVAELQSILETAGLSARDALSTRSRVYKERGDDIDLADDDTLIELMVEEPTLLRRPMVIGGGGVVLGHNPRQLEKMIAANQTDGSTQA